MTRCLQNINPARNIGGGLICPDAKRSGLPASRMPLTGAGCGSEPRTNPATDRDHRIGHGQPFRANPWRRERVMPADDFVTRTHALLTQLSREAASIRRSIDQHHACRGCSKCDALRVTHARIDDHLQQLDLYTLDPEPDPPDCTMCGRRRYTACEDGTVVCAACDGLTGGRTWVGIPDSEDA